MKRRGIVFDRKVRETNSGGLVRLYFCPEELWKLLGQGESLVFHGFVHSRTANAKVTFYAFDSAIKGVVPHDQGCPLSLTGASVVQTTGVFRFELPSPFMTDLEIVAEVGVTSGTNTESIEFELSVSISES